MKWWSEWFIPLLIASGVLLIFKGGVAVTILLWIVYIGNGVKTVNAIPSEENNKELFLYLFLHQQSFAFYFNLRNFK